MDSCTYNIATSTFSLRVHPEEYPCLVCLVLLVSVRGPCHGVSTVVWATLVTGQHNNVMSVTLTMLTINLPATSTCILS